MGLMDQYKLQEIKNALRDPLIKQELENLLAPIVSKLVEKELRKRK